MSIVVANEADVALAIRQLAILGYKHLGNLGIEASDSFTTPEGLVPFHFYVCPTESLGLHIHLQFRDHLRCHAEEAATYGTLKKALAERFPDDIEVYVDGQRDFIVEILSEAGMPCRDRDSVEAANRMD